MANKVPLKKVSNILTSVGTLNEDFERIEEGFDKTLSRDGSGPNQMEALIDMNHYPIINLPKAHKPGMPVTYDQLDPGTQEVVVVPVDTDNIINGAITADKITTDPDDLTEISDKLNFSPQVKPSQRRTILDKLREEKSILDLIPVEYHADIKAETSTVDVQPYFQEAANAGGKWLIPKGRYMVGSPIIREDTGFHLRGEGIDNSIIEPLPTFSGSSVFILGKKNVKDECRDICMSDFMIHLKARVDCAIEMYALRDGSTFRSIYVWEIRKYGFRTGWAGTGINDPWTMNQGLLFENCHVLSRRDGGELSDGAYFDLSGLYESTFIGCKALGYGLGANHTNMVGWNIGPCNVVPGDYDCQAVRLINCSVGGIEGLGNVGIMYGYVTNCSDTHTTFEGVGGHAVQFRKKGPGSPSFCFVETPRIYNPAGSTTTYTTHFFFAEDTICCGVKDLPTMSALPGQVLAHFRDNVINCFVEVRSGDVSPASMVGSYILFDTANYSNYVRIYTNDTVNKVDSLLTKEQYSQTRLPDGTLIETTQYYTNVRGGSTLHLLGPTGNPVVSINTDSLGFYGATPTTKPVVTGSIGGNAALNALLTALNTLGLITNNTTA